VRRFLSLLLLATSLGLLPACGGGAGGGGDDAGTVPIPPDVPSGTERALALQVFDLVNRERVAHDLPPLEWDEDVAQVAYEHSYDMDVRDYFSHTTPEGLSPGQRATAAGIEWTAYGENIAYGQPTPEAVMEAWMDSEGHRENILGTWYTRIGIGVQVAPGGPWWTQNFYSP
jgi:uncharacterized protein YkwD